MPSLIRRAGIMAGGRGERLRRGRETLKPLVAIAGRPLIDLVLSSIAETSVDEVTILVNEASVSVKDVVAQTTWPFDVRWIVETTPSSMHSFLRVIETLAARDADEPYLISTVDTVATPGTCRGFAAASARSAADVVLAINHIGHDDHPLRVQLASDGRRVAAIGQSVRPSDGAAGHRIPHVWSTADGEAFATCGFYAVRPSILREAAAARSDGLTALRLFLARLLARGYAVEAVRVPDSVDVDHPADIEMAEALLKAAGP